MALAVIGFRRANQTTGRQITAVVTQSGFLHKSSGALGMAGRLHCARDVKRFPSKPGGHPAQESVMLLRRLHDTQQHTYTRIMIAPAAVRLDDGVDEASTAQVIEAFTGAAPSGLRPLEDAITAFYQAIGQPVRPAPATARAWRSAAPSSPRSDQYLRVLAQGSPLSARHHHGTGYTITPDAVCLHYNEPMPLARAQVFDLHAALTAWLRLNPDEQ
ncbi:hypothetical protein [Streptomyces sp. NPDC050485]|uniref:hypothetical protein n=1 Tax=Streptomyces sp. NPDC050485 TaxID=3365617 RepID=UPI0037B7F7E9